MKKLLLCFYMLKQFRTKHIKIILWGLLIVVVPSFVFWGVSSFFKEKKENIYLSIEGHVLSYPEFKNYITTAVIYYRLTLGEDFYTKISQSLIETRAYEILLLLWKAKKEKLEVADREVIEIIQNKFSIDGKFDKDLYLRYIKDGLRMPPRIYEEHIRKILTAEKVLDRYVRVIETEESEIKELYKKENEKVKISYILIPYERFNEEITMDEKEIKEFYETNKKLFKEGPKIKIKYIVLNKTQDQELINRISRSTYKIKNIETLAEKLSLTPQTSPYLEMNSPIEGIGFNQKINDIAFAIPKGTLSPIIELESSFVLFEKVEEKEGFIPELEIIRWKVIDKLKEEKKKTKAEELGEEILKEIAEKNIEDLNQIAKGYNLETKNTNYFSRIEPSQDLNLDSKINELIFNLKKGQIYRKVILQSGEAYIIKLDDFIPMDVNEFKKNGEKYRQRILAEKMFFRHLNFLSELEKEAKVKRVK